MTVSDLIRAGGGLDEQAFERDAELARYEVRDGQTRRTDVHQGRPGSRLGRGLSPPTSRWLLSICS